ncbi:hypothetical protein D9758_001054 [Tetrapyrgos nigripes]|uniref:Peptidase A1 domain-containing protein n=1 Tax=Tetrapyrgos nigripes TaxID=182062 RepID=A0A8H5GRQ1_9AGAR|nr:hypothetical protein D9758_001054 [Tetrapyrgos nigripes]
MKCHVYTVLLLCHVLPSLAATFSVTKQSRASSNFRVLAASGDDNSLDINTAQDLIYMANITVGGNSYVVQLDTGSSDLWIQGPSFPLPNGSPTAIAHNVTYGIGWAYGNVSYAEVEFAGISVKKQGFLDVSSAQNPALGYGANGILGLGFTSLSTVDALVNSTGFDTGRSLLYNLFEDNPSEPNFIAFALQRTKEDNQDDVEGSFSVGEYEPAYASVADTPAIPTWPEKSPKRWSVIVEALLIGDKTITPTTIVPDVPSNRAVAVLDTGTSYSYAPKDICDAIYSGISGASFDPLTGQWTVPCNVEVDIAIQIGGRVFPLHPLDVAPKSVGSDSVCVGSFVAQSFSSGNQFDWLVGDNFLRSVYSIYDFGDFDSNHQMGDPYVKLLSLIKPDEASSEFAQARGTTAKTGITYNSSNETANAASSTSVTLSADVADTIAKIGNYFPAVLAVLALNAVVLLTILIVGVVLLCQRRKKRRLRAAKGRTAGRLTPMPMNSNGEVSPEEPVYQPVSMALTEDTFVPPMASFRKHSFGGDGRPTSVATLPPKMYNIAEGPPSPGFKEFDARPRSMAAFGVQHRASTSSAMPLNGPTPEDEPFVAPRSPRAPSIRSYHSQNSGYLQESQGASGIPMQEFPPSSPSGPEKNEPHTPIREATLSGVTLSDAPMARAFSKNVPAMSGVTLTDAPVPRAPFRNADPRPMSVGNHPSAEFAHPNLPPRRAPPPAPAPAPEVHHMAEEDITLAPPNPFYLRSGGGNSADRPRSVA